MKRTLIFALAAVMLLGCVALIHVGVQASNLPFDNLFVGGFGGYTSHEGQILTSDFVSSQPVDVQAGQTVWFGPCEPAQYFHLIGTDASGYAVTGKIRSKELTKVDTFGNGTVIYKYTVPSGVEKLLFSAPAELANIFTAATTYIDSAKWLTYWEQQGVNTEDFVGANTYYKANAGTKLYFGAVTKASALESVYINAKGEIGGTISESDLRLVENFGGDFGIYCYTVPENADMSLIRIKYDEGYEKYYTCLEVPKDETVEDTAVVDQFIAGWGIPQPLDETVQILKGKSALFLGDSITYGARDRQKIYQWGGWAGRIDYHVGMNVTNNGVSGACITTARRESSSEAHYIYNNLYKTNGTTYDYVIMHGLFNDASEKVAVGEVKGPGAFDPETADVTKYAPALEKLFYQARLQNPDAILGFIVNFHTDRAVDQAPYVEAAIEACKAWGIPYLDLYNRPGFSVEFDDGLHPSSAGYDSMYTIVANWMATLASDSVSGDYGTDNAATVMSYNIFWDTAATAGTEYAAISNRTTKVLGVMQQNPADILMLQEVSPTWMNILKTVDGYQYYGYSHKKNVEAGGMSGNDEAAPIFWNENKFAADSSGNFHVDDANYPRTINWVVLKDKTTGSKLLVLNYHAVPDKDGNDGETKRRETAKLIVEKIDEIRRTNDHCAVIIGGDWNMAESSVAYSTVVGNGLLDGRYVADAGSSVGSYNAWTRTNPGSYAKGDYIFLAEGMKSESFTVVTDDWANEEKTLHVSDHCPLIAKINY